MTKKSYLNNIVLLVQDINIFQGSYYYYLFDVHFAAGMLLCLF